ncbi:MAG: helix-turn-helix transcriptional regulator [Eubacterium sp.]|nr:helix-turn-helix transcriptional regulator [Eubacterium sp.]
MGHYGIIWDDELDIETETIYEEGITVRVEMISHSDVAARAVAYARSLAGISQKELSGRTGIDQADISKIERSVANPSISTLERIASALGGELVIEIRMGEEKHK